MSEKNGSTLTKEEQVARVAEFAYKLGNRQGLITQIEKTYKSKDEDGKEIEKTTRSNVGSFEGVGKLAKAASEKKSPSSVFYGAKNRFLTKGESHPFYSSIIAKAKAAKGDLVAGNWTAKVQDFLNEFIKSTGRSTATYDASELEGFNF